MKGNERAESTTLKIRLSLGNVRACSRDTRAHLGAMAANAKIRAARYGADNNRGSFDRFAASTNDSLCVCEVLKRSCKARKSPKGGGRVGRERGRVARH